MKSRTYIVLVCFSILVAAQSGLKPNSERMVDRIGDISPEEISLDSVLLRSQTSRDSIYHAGALMVRDLNNNARYLKSSFCVSCHDGIFVPEGHTSTNFGNPSSIDPSSLFSFNHPVAFEYSSKLAQAKNHLNDPYVTPSGMGGTVADDLMVEGRIECVTCHNIFFKPAMRERFEVLNKSNNGSGLCLTCHKR